jgi:hypothetical protein
LLLVDGQEITLRSLTDAAMEASPAPTTQAVEEDQSAFRKQLRQSMENQGLQALPNKSTPPDQVNRYLQPFYKQLAQSRAAAEKNYKA